MTRIVVVGSQSAGFTAASFARVFDRRAEVTLVERREYGLYHPCGTPLAIQGKVDFRSLVHPSPPPGVRIMCGTEAVRIDPDSKKVTLRGTGGGREDTMSYDSLVIATGGMPIRPDIPGADFDGVFTLRTVEDGESLVRRVQMAKIAVVIGGGPVGVEVSLSLRSRGVNVTLIEQKPHLLPAMLDPDMAEPVAEKLASAGVDVVCGSAVSEVIGDGEVRGAVAGGKEYVAQLAVFATGVKPRTEIAEASGIKVGRTGGIVVDHEMRTSALDVFAAGECAETRNAITGMSAVSFLASTAMSMGRVAGINAAGGRAKFRGALGATVTSIDEMVVGCTGLNSSVAELCGIGTVSARVRVPDRPSYVPGNPVLVKLLADSGNGRIVGGQIIGRSGVAEMIDMLSLAIMSGASAEDLMSCEHGYMPLVSDLMSPVQVAADALMRKMR